MLSKDEPSTSAGFVPALDQLLGRHDDTACPSLENRVAFQWERPPDTLGYRQSVKRDQLILKWLGDAVRAAEGAAAVLDLGCAYGNHLLMLNAYLDKDTTVELYGLDLDERSVKFGQRFAATVRGYQNCHFTTGDLTSRLPFDDDTFVAVNIADVLEHLTAPESVLAEIHRVLRPGGSVIISTPLRESAFKAIAKGLNRVTMGRLYREYYAGKDTSLDAVGEPVMETHVGHDHVSEMTYAEIVELVHRAGYDLREVELMPIMSGSSWFDKHPFLLSGLVLMEAMHTALRRPSWAHAVCIRAVA